MPVTGKGDAPLRSAWLGAPSLLWAVIQWADDDPAISLVWRDFFFSAAAVSGTGAITTTATLAGSSAHGVAGTGGVEAQATLAGAGGPGSSGTGSIEASATPAGAGGHGAAGTAAVQAEAIASAAGSHSGGGPTVTGSGAVTARAIVIVGAFTWPTQIVRTRRASGKRGRRRGF